MLALDDGDVRIHLGDALKLARSLPDRSVHMIATSPPFWNLRDYGTGTWLGGDEACDHRRPPSGGPKSGPLEGTGKREANGALYARQCGRCGAVRTDEQIGAEASPDEWAAGLVELFGELRRVLRDDGTLWLEVGDSWNAYNGNRGPSSQLSKRADRGRNAPAHGLAAPDLKPKDMIGQPWLLAFALRADGWVLRSEIIWARPNPMPESVRDRPTKAHSTVFLLSKGPRYFYDSHGWRPEAANDARAGGRQRAARGLAKPQAEELWTFQADASDAGRRERLHGVKRRTVRPGVDTNGGGQGTGEMTYPLDSANARSYWEIPTEPTPFEHYATWPRELCRRMILLGSSERGACSCCGAPMRRLVETKTVERDEIPPDDPRSRPGQYRTGVSADVHEGANAGMRYTSSRTVGWDPSCACDAPAEPCVILDPFMGSGTTALVARSLGRRAIGFELNPDSIAIARERLAQLSLLA